MAMNRILVTGSSGRVGRDAVRALKATGWHVIGLDRVTPPDDSDLPNELVFGHADRPRIVADAVHGVDCVIHLAAAPDDDPLPESIDATLPDDDNFLSQLVPSNIVLPVTVLKAAVRAGVRRVILASSGQVIDGWLAGPTARVDEQTPFAPRYLYACTKVYLEALGRVFAKKYGLEVLAARLGWCPRPGQAAAVRAYPLAPYVYLSGTDAGRFFAAAAGSSYWPRTTDPKGGAFPFGVAYVTSRPPGGHEVYDLSAARRLGYEPDSTDTWDAWVAAHGR
jgi:nucleoside-diphosphate-sugar epimerase